MPQVPRYTSPQVSPNALPGARLSDSANPAAFGATQARQMQEAGGVVSQAGALGVSIAADLQERENATLVFAAESALKDDWIKYETDLKKRKGAGAWGATDDTEKWFEEKQKEHAKTLTNDRQRSIFSQSFTKMRQSGMTAVSAYEMRERDQYLAESAQASIAGTIDIMAANAGSLPEEQLNRTIAGGRRDILARIDVMAKLNGWGPEKRELEATRYTTILHRQVLGALVDENPDGAQKYYDTHKEEIAGTERAEIERVLKIGGVRKKGQESVEHVLAEGMTEAQALSYVRKEYAGEAEDEIVQRVKSRYAEFDQMREKGQRRAADAAWSAYARARRLDDVPASVIASMDGRDIETLRRHAANVASGTQVKTDPSAYYALKVMAADEPSAFKSVDLRRYVNSLSPSDFQEMVKLQTGSESELKDAATFQQQLAVSHNLLKFGRDDAEKKGMFDKAATDAVNAEQQRLGKKLNYDERQQVIDRMMLSGEIPGFFNDEEGRFFEFTDRRDEFVPEVEDADRTAIEESARKKYGREPTDAEIIQIYKTWKGIQ